MRYENTITPTEQLSHPKRRGLPSRFLSVTATAFIAASLAGCVSGTGGDRGGVDETGWSEASSAIEAGVSPLVFIGDSVAAGLAQPLQQAMAASGARFVDKTSAGGGNLVGPNAEAQWKDLPATVGEASGGLVMYQVTTYDWGSPEAQREAYARLADLAHVQGADLVLISMPPIEADDFYADHLDELETANRAAQAVADERDGVEYFDSSEVWGSDYARERDGKVDRSTDGIHACPQGAARFTSWVLDGIAEIYPDFEPADPADWAHSGWAESERFTGCE